MQWSPDEKLEDRSIISRGNGFSSIAAKGRQVANRLQSLFRLTGSPPLSLLVFTQ
jgi:hypothetical protein